MHHASNNIHCRSFSPIPPWSRFDLWLFCKNIVMTSSLELDIITFIIHDWNENVYFIYFLIQYFRLHHPFLGETEYRLSDDQSHKVRANDKHSTRERGEKAMDNFISQTFIILYFSVLVTIDNLSCIYGRTFGAKGLFPKELKVL